MRECSHGSVGLTWTTCPYGLCSVGICHIDRRIWGSFGPIDCPCDHTPGWKSSLLEGMGKPRPAVLAKGRHRSRIERSIRRHRPSRSLVAMRNLQASFREDVGVEEYA